MKRLLSCAAMLAMILLAGHAETTTPVKKKSAPKQGASKKSASTKKPASSSAKRASATKKGTSTASTHGKNPPVKKTTWRNRQSTPSPERYREIQTALATRGYLKPDEATGTWNAASGEALKKFQAEQNLESKGKINSLSLIALGLGPHREPAATPHPASKDQQPSPGQYRE